MIKARLTTIPHLLSAGLRQQVNMLTAEAERARAIREFGKVAQIADRLFLILPIRTQTIAAYYQAIALRNVPESAVRLELLTDGPLATVRARAQLALGSHAFRLGDFSQAAYRYDRATCEFSRTPDLIGMAHLAKMHALLNSERGQHGLALLKLQSVWRMLQGTNTPSHYDLLNSICIELLAVGHTDAAQRLIGQVVESPFVAHYPEWLESQQQIEQAVYRSSAVTVPKLPKNVTQLADYRRVRTNQANFAHRSSLCDQIIFGAYYRMIDRADMSFEAARHIISLLNN